MDYMCGTPKDGREKFMVRRLDQLFKVTIVHRKIARLELELIRTLSTQIT